MSSLSCEPVYEIIPEPEAEVYMTIAEFSAAAGDSINFQPGMVCTVVTKNANGWWYVDMDGEEGWVPSSYLEKVSGDGADSVETKLPPTSPSQPVREKLAAKTEPKIAVVKSEPVKEVKRREPPVPRKNEPPPTQSRKTFLNNAAANHERKSSLRRSTSTDSGLNEDVDGSNNRPKIKPLRSPPGIRVNPAPPRPTRPKTSPTTPNGPKSPRPGGKSTLKAAISSPVAVQMSPAARRKSEATSVRLEQMPSL